MTSTLARLAAFIAAVLAFSSRQVASSPADCRSETDSRLTLDAATRYHKAWASPVPGTKPLFGLNERVLALGKRDCLGNGSNYCFGKNVDFCPGCGNCCLDGNYCCGKGKVCCGSGCCEGDQVCSEGKCLSSLAPVTVTSIIIQIVTRVATQRATVVVVELETSTVVSDVDVTISTASTQTNIVWVAVTTTAAAKRAVISLDPPAPSTSGIAASEQTLEPADAKRSQSVRTVPLQSRSNHAPIPRQTNQAEASTVTDYVTQIAEVTVISSTIITVRTTSTEVTTVYLTNTRVLKAETTTTITSTLTFTSHPASSRTLTTTFSPILSAATTTALTNSSTITYPSSEQPHPLPTQTIAGIAAGSSALAVLLAGFIVLAIRRRHHLGATQDVDEDEDGMCYAGGYSGYNGGGGRGGGKHGIGRKQFEPTVPSVLPHFAVLPPAHHAVEYRLPFGAGVSSDGTGSGSGSGIGQQQQSLTQAQDQVSATGGGVGGHHQRNGSGYTTLVGPLLPLSLGSNFRLLGVLARREERKVNWKLAEAQGDAVQDTDPGTRWRGGG